MKPMKERKTTKPMTRIDLRTAISETFVKWSLGTRQVAILDILSLVDQYVDGVIEKAKPEKQEHRFTCIRWQTPAICDCTAEGFNLGADQFEMNLREFLKGGE